MVFANLVNLAQPFLIVFVSLTTLFGILLLPLTDVFLHSHLV